MSNSSDTSNKEICSDTSAKEYVTQVEKPLKLMFKDMLKYTPSKLFGILGNAVIVPVYTNLLSPEQYGIYTISLAVLSFLCILFSDWVGLAGLRFFRKHEMQKEIPKFLSTLVMLLTVNVISMFVIAFIFRHAFYDFFKIPSKLFLVILVLIIPVAIRALLFQILRAQIKPSAFTVSTIANQILTILISVGVIKYFHLGGISILIGMFVSIAIIDIVLMFQSNIFEYFKCEKPRWDTLKSLYIYGVPIAVASISLWFITQSNKFILRHFNGFSEVGLVGVAYGLTFPILMTLFAIITIAAFPRIINMYEEKIDVRPIISKLTGYFMLVAVPLAAVMSLYSLDIVHIFANQKFEKAAVLIPYLSFGAVFLSFSEYTTMQFHLANKTYINTALKVFSGVLGLGLNFVLIKKYGIIGAGIATLVTNFVYFVLTAAISLPKLNWQIPYKEILKLIICFIPFTAFYYFLVNKTYVYPVYQMILLLMMFYGCYFMLNFVKISHKK